MRKERPIMRPPHQTFPPRKTVSRPRNRGQSHAGLVKACQPMSLSLFVRKARLCCLVFSIPAIALAQSSFRTNSGEYRISGALAGDQIHAQLSINSSGGFIVWDDNNTDGDGQGISAAALDSNFNRVQSSFRVNQTRALDQEQPQVALLN